MNDSAVPSPSEISRRETRFYAWGMAGMFGALFLYFAFTLQPPLSPPALILFGGVSAALMGGYLWLTPRGLHLPRGAGARLRLQFPLLSATWALLFFFLLRGTTAIYFYLAAFDEYVSLALFHSRRAAATWAATLLGLMSLAYALLTGPAGAARPLLNSLPAYALM